MSTVSPRPTTLPASAFALSGLTRKLEFGDALIPLYVLVFVRQFFWPVHNQAAAWIFTIVLTLLIWLAYLITKPAPRERTPRAFWLIVLLPLLFVFCWRVAFPDLSFDVLNQRLFQSERALRGPEFLPGDFFPIAFPLNPSSDMLTGLFRHIIGFRFGTVISLLALVWTGTILEKILRPFVVGQRWRCLCVLLALFTEHVLFEINNYMVDLLALPILFEVLRLALDYDQSESRRRDFLYSAILLGAGLGLKLTNAVVIVPLGLVLAWRIVALRDRKVLVWAPLAAVLFLLPLLPHAIFIWRLTGSPVFPLYNSFIKSPFWPASSPADGRWGPRSSFETIVWTVRGAWMPERLSELGVYSGRLALGFLAALLCLLLRGIGSRARLIAVVVLLSSLMWSATSGYVRYALFTEIAGGIVLVILARYILAHMKTQAAALQWAAAALPICLLVAQCVLSAVYAGRNEWGGRPTIFRDPRGYRRELRWVNRDRDLMSFQPDDNRQLFSQVDAWIVSSVKSNGVEVLLRPDVPALGVVYLEYFDRPEGRRQFAAAIDALRGKRIYSLALNDELDAAMEALRRRRLKIGEIKPVIVPYFSARTRLHFSIIEVFPPDKPQAMRRSPDTPLISEATAPLDDEAFLAGFSVTDAPVSMKPEQTATLRVTVKNLSDFVWPARGRKDYAYLINLSDSWLSADGVTMVNNMDGRNSLPHDLWPGESVEIPLEIKAPAKPGEYIIEVGLVQEGIAFFKDKGSPTWRARIKVD